MDEAPKEREPTPFDTAFKMAAEREPEALLRLVGEAGEVIRAIPGTTPSWSLIRPSPSLGR